jgi:hypothetical protein
MSLFEEYLTLGPWLAEEQRRDLYKFLLKTRREKYRIESEALLQNRVLNTLFANGAILYLIKDSVISYKTKRVDEPSYGDEVRSLPLRRFNFLNTARIRKFFAQAELDVLRNYPNPGKELEKNRGFGFNVYAYYDLNYYSNGRGKILGILNKIRTTDGELLHNLLASRG